MPWVPMSPDRTVAFEPRPDAYAPKTSWWSEMPREGFTEYAKAQWLERMQYARYAHMTTLARGPSSASPLELAKQRKGLEASR